MDVKVKTDNAPANQTANAGHSGAPSPADTAAQSEFGKALKQEATSSQTAPEGLSGQNTPGGLVNNLSAGAHAIVEGTIWNPTVWGSIGRDAEIARDTGRGVWVERFRRPDRSIPTP